MKTNTYPDEIQGLMEHHGHLCFGVLLGYKACRYAVEIIGQSDNMLVITEEQNCGTDAVRFLLNCTADNGKLIIRKGKGHSWSFYNNDEEDGIRLTVNPNIKSHLPADKDQALQYLLELPGNLLFLAEPFSV